MRVPFFSRYGNYLQLLQHTYTYSVFFFIKILIHIYMKKTNYRKQSWYLNNCDKKDGKLSFCQRFPHAHPPSMPKRHKMVWTEELAILVQKPGKNQVKPQLEKLCDFCLCGLNSSGDSHSIGSERNLESMPSMKNYSFGSCQKKTFFFGKPFPNLFTHPPTPGFL